MMTGKTPFETGVVATLHCAPDTPSGRLSDNVPTLAEILAQNGIQTYAIDNLMNFACHPSWFVRGFGEYVNPNPESFVTRLIADRMNDVLFGVLDGVREPFFLWAHYWDPHLPYNQPDEFLAPFDTSDGDAHVKETADGRRYVPGWGSLDALENGDWAGGRMRARSGDRVQGSRNMINAYDGEILYLDTRLGDVFDRMKTLGLYDDTCILFTSDHGETMADQLTHFCHVQALDACTRLPLIVKPAKGMPAKQGSRSGLATHTDLAPTILDLWDVSTDIPIEGRSLKAALEGTEDNLRDHVVSTGMYLLEEGLWKSIEVAARTARWRLVHKSRLTDYPKEGLRLSKLWEIIAELYESEPPDRLYDVANDPDETTDVADENPSVVEKVRQHLKPAIESPYFYTGE